jgi:hypothetical protein
MLLRFILSPSHPTACQGLRKFINPSKRPHTPGTASPSGTHDAGASRTRPLIQTLTAASPHSTVTLLARLRGLSTSVPLARAVW